VIREIAKILEPKVKEGGCLLNGSLSYIHEGN